jgi:pectate lyase
MITEDLKFKWSEKVMSINRGRREALTALGVSLASLALGGFNTQRELQLGSEVSEMRLRLPYSGVEVLRYNGNYYAYNERGEVICVNSPTSCIQEAVDYAAANYGIVHIWHGLYEVAESVVIDSARDLTLIGDGASTVIMLKSGITATHALMLKGTISNLTIANMAFDGNYENVTDVGTSSRVDEELVELATAQSVENLTLYGVEVRHTRGGAGINIGNARNVKLINIHVHDNGLPTSEYACDAVHMGFVNNAVVLGSVFENVTDTGVAVDSSSGVVITGNVFRNCHSQCSTYTPAGGVPNESYRGYVFSSNIVIKDEPATFINGGVVIGGFLTTSPPPHVYDILIANNIFMGRNGNTLSAISVQEAADYINIIGNVFVNCTGGIIPQVYELENGLVSGNIFNNCQIPYIKIPGLVIKD